MKISYLPLILISASLVGCNGSGSPYEQSVECMGTYYVSSLPVVDNAKLQDKEALNREMLIADSLSKEMKSMHSVVIKSAAAEGVDQSNAEKAINSVIHDLSVDMQDNSPSDNNELIEDARSEVATCKNLLSNAEMQK